LKTSQSENATKLEMSLVENSNKLDLVMYNNVTSMTRISGYRGMLETPINQSLRALATNFISQTF